MKALLPVFLLLAGEAAVAQAPPPPATAKPAALPRRIEGVSDAGNAIFAKAQAAPDPDLVALARQQRQLRDQLSAAALATTIEPDRIETLLRKSEEVQGAIRTRNNDRLLAVLRQLPESDRAPFLRGVLPKPVPAR